MISGYELGDVLFGRGLRLAVAAWIRNSESELFFQSEVAKGVEYVQSAVSQELNRLIALGMVQKVPRSRGDRRQYYLRTNSQLWNIIDAALEVIDEQSFTATQSSP